MDGENNQLEKTMEVAGIRIYHYGWIFFLQKGCHNIIKVEKEERDASKEDTS